MSFSPPQGFIGGAFLDLARVQAPGGTLSLTANFRPVRNLKIYAYFEEDGAGAINMKLRINGDTNNNYAYRRQQNNDAWSTSTSANDIELDPGTIGQHEFNILDIIDVEGVSKLFHQDMTGTDKLDDPTDDPPRQEVDGLYSVPTVRVTSLEFFSGNAVFSNNSYIRVLGYN